MPIPTNKGIIEPKRPPGPVNITSLTILNPARSNVVSVQWKNDFGRQYVFSVSLVRKLTSMQLLTRLKNKGTKHSDFTRSLSEYILNKINVMSRINIRNILLH